MSQIKPSHLIISLAVAFALGGCGDTNPQAVFSPENGHTLQPDWNLTHKTSAKANLDGCIECHGENLDGGISKVSCTTCHPAGPTSKHPVRWEAYAYARHAATYNAELVANPTKPTTCATNLCHGTTLAGTASAPSCANAIGCHLGGTDKKHPTDWATLPEAITKHGQYFIDRGYEHGVPNPDFDFTSCQTSTCHGTYGLGVLFSGNSCAGCHPMY